MVLNHKSWEHADDKPMLSKVYADLYYKLHDYLLDNWTDEDLDYYLSTTD